jgi:hypothetical protein
MPKTATMTDLILTKTMSDKGTIDCLGRLDGIVIFPWMVKK